MKKLIIALFVGISFLANTSAPAQNTDTNKTLITTLTDTTFLVNGVCGMCEYTIESAAKIEGVEYADWDVETKVLSIGYFPNKTSLEKIAEAINKSGYDTEYNLASEEAYNKLHKCCRYRDAEVIKEHK